jgi:multicomponent Na+:H+ antiporter subunit D
MSEQYPVLVLLIPLFTALLVGFVGMANRRICYPLVVAAMAACVADAIGILHRVLAEGPISYVVGGWTRPAGIGIQLHIDTLNALVLLAVTTAGLLTAVFSFRRDDEDKTKKSPLFYALFLLFIMGLCGMTITGDAFNLYVLIEVASLTGYALIAMGRSKRAAPAAFKYIIMGTIGASFYLLGVGCLYLRTGTLNMVEIHNTIASLGGEGLRTVHVAFAMILVGLLIKMAFFPLHGWLPNAYTYCPSTSACAMAPLMTKVSVYVMIRMMLTVFGAEWVFQSTPYTQWMVRIAVVAILAGSALALAQTRLRKMFCYLIVAEVGYMVGGAWLANHWGMVGAVYHILGDAFMTLCMFLVAAALLHQARVTKLSHMEGMFRRQPLTMGVFVVGALSMIGVPPTCGFFSKWYLIRGGIESGHWEYVAALLISSLVNAVLFFRIFEIAYFGNKPAAGHGHHGDDAPADAGTTAPPHWSRAAPLLAVATIILLLGIFNREIVEWIERSLAGMKFIGTMLPQWKGGLF